MCHVFFYEAGASTPEAHEPIVRQRVLGRVGHHVDLRAGVILQNQVAALIAELHTSAVEEIATHDQERAPR